jgi:hypothetical protein
LNDSTPINQDGFFGKTNKYQYSDLVKLKHEPLNQLQFGNPSLKNNSNIRDLVSNYYNKEYVQKQHLQEQRYQQNLKSQLDRIKALSKSRSAYSNPDGKKTALSKSQRRERIDGNPYRTLEEVR